MKTKIILLFLIFNIFDKCRAKCVYFPNPTCEILRKVYQGESQSISVQDVLKLNDSFEIQTILLDTFVDTPKQRTGGVMVLTKDNFTYICDSGSVPYYTDIHEKTPIALLSLQSEIEIFGPQFFNIYKTLEILALKSYQPELFKHLKSLRELYINSANIESIEAEVFLDLIYLEVLDLSDNQIQTIHSDSFANLPSLVTLNLSGNNITSIDQNIFEILPIKNLIMNNNLCANGSFKDANQTDIMNVLSDCFKLYRPRLLINEDQNYQWMSEINALKIFAGASKEKLLTLTKWYIENSVDLGFTIAP